jgi:hypothetical protein
MAWTTDILEEIGMDMCAWITFGVNLDHFIFQVIHKNSYPDLLIGSLGSLGSLFGDKSYFSGGIRARFFIYIYKKK